MKKVVGYVRRSVESDNLSLQTQEKSIRAFVDSQGWELTNLYCDSSESGKSLQRPAYQEMMTNISSQHEKPDLVLVMKLDRISRRLKDILEIEDFLRSMGIGLKSVTESFDSSTSAGALLISLLGSFAEFERRVIIERTSLGRTTLAENGGFPGGPIPYGYMKNPNGSGLIPDSKESKIVVKLFSVFSSHGWSSQRLKLSTGCPLHRDSISDLLSNPLYAGLVEYDGRLSKGDHEAIVTIRMFNKVQELKLLKSRGTSSLFKVHGTTKIPLKLAKN